MANTMISESEATLALHTPRMGRVDDYEELRQFFSKDRYANAYLLGYLDPMYQPFGKWYGLRDIHDELQCVLLHYIGLSIPVVFLVGQSEHLDVFLKYCKEDLPKRFHFHIPESQRPIFEQSFDISSAQLMQRMGLHQDAYTPVPIDRRVERLGHRDTAQIMALYGHYPDHFFEPYQMETGLYFGVRDPKHGLVSISGIHSVNPHDDISVVGNLVTHPSARGQGLAKACTGALLNELYKRVSYVALNVQVDNIPAITVYESFGFVSNNTYFEGRCG